MRHYICGAVSPDGMGRCIRDERHEGEHEDERRERWC